MPDYYEILGVAPDATEDDIRKAFRAKAKLQHPDTITGAKEAMVALNAAYETLRDTHRRQTYNVKLARSAARKGRVSPPARGVAADVFLARVFGPSDREIALALTQFEAALADLAYDPYDEAVVAQFGRLVGIAGKALAAASERLHKTPWPSTFAPALNLYGQGTRQLEDALADFQDFLTSFDIDQIVEGHAILASAVEMLAEARAALPTWGRP
jgi:curved DNA-binding protein CbpA